MTQKRSIFFGVLFALLVVAGGLALIVAKEWLWGLFELLYGMLGISGQRTHMWAMFTTTIGLGVVLAGLVLLLAVLQRARN